MKFFWRSISIFGVAVLLFTQSPQVALVAENSGIQETFNVSGTSLRIEGQGQEYFTQPGRKQKIPPVAAFILRVIDFLALTIGSVALLIFIVGGLITVVSEGREDRLEKGKSAMLYAIYGILIAFTAYLITTFVQSILYA